MTPIVDGLEAEYGAEVDFHRLNARDGGPGQAAFDAYNLRAHPAIVIVSPDGTVTFESLGIVAEEQVQQALDAVQDD